MKRIVPIVALVSFAYAAVLFGCTEKFPMEEFPLEAGTPTVLDAMSEASIDDSAADAPFLDSSTLSDANDANADASSPPNDAETDACTDLDACAPIGDAE